MIDRDLATLMAADLTDHATRLVLADALEDAGRTEEAALCRSRPNVRVLRDQVVEWRQVVEEYGVQRNSSGEYHQVPMAKVHEPGMTAGPDVEIDDVLGYMLEDEFTDRLLDEDEELHIDADGVYGCSRPCKWYSFLNADGSVSHVGLREVLQYRDASGSLANGEWWHS